ncbi:unnamed protein product [Prorocentrum cordatum]|uniref:Uncharacterized protein n=1 Tax=Prorocentrum cordatum TaxID=2364126 RepID=A0ABN9UDK4_9DINO|nr:unnamed protein product [Polarella glacialis]
MDVDWADSHTHAKKGDCKWGKGMGKHGKDGKSNGDKGTDMEKTKFQGRCERCGKWKHNRRTAEKVCYAKVDHAGAWHSWGGAGRSDNGGNWGLSGGWEGAAPAPPKGGEKTTVGAITYAEAGATAWIFAVGCHGARASGAEAGDAVGLAAGAGANGSARGPGEARGDRRVGLKRGDLCEISRR